MRLAAHVAEVPESEDISGGQGHQMCFRSSGPPGVFSEVRGIRKENVLWCPGNFEIRGRFWVRGTRKENMLWCPENFAERGISRKSACRYPKRQ